LFCAGGGALSGVPARVSPPAHKPGCALGLCSGFGCRPG